MMKAWCLILWLLRPLQLNTSHLAPFPLSLVSFLLSLISFHFPLYNLLSPMATGCNSYNPLLNSPSLPAVFSFFLPPSPGSRHTSSIPRDYIPSEKLTDLYAFSSFARSCKFADSQLTQFLVPTVIKSFVTHHVTAIPAGADADMIKKIMADLSRTLEVTKFRLDAHLFSYSSLASMCRCIEERKLIDHQPYSTLNFDLHFETTLRDFFEEVLEVKEKRNISRTRDLDHSGVDRGICVLSSSIHFCHHVWALRKLFNSGDPARPVPPVTPIGSFRVYEHVSNYLVHGYDPGWSVDQGNRLCSNDTAVFYCLTSLSNCRILVVCLWTTSQDFEAGSIYHTRQEFDIFVRETSVRDVVSLFESVASRLPPSRMSPSRMSRVHDMFRSTSSGSTTTSGITISISYIYVLEDPNHIGYAYSVSMKLEEDSPYDVVRLLTRHWRFTSPEGGVKRVDGEGVIGYFPFLYRDGTYMRNPMRPPIDRRRVEGAFRYQSCTGPADRVASMEGSLRFEATGNDGVSELVNAEIPRVEFQSKTCSHFLRAKDDDD